MNHVQYFYLRRLHSLLGVFPLGVFLFNHLLTNSTGLISSETFEHKVALIHMLGPLLPLVEAAFIFIPLSLHIAMGVYIATTGTPEKRLNYGRNWAYRFQRITGWIALLFVVYHVIHLRFLHDMHAAPFSFALASMFTGKMAILYVPAYLIGAASVVFHFANGLCTFCMTWGITVGPQSQKAMAKLATAVGAVLMAMTLASVVGFTREGLRFRALDSEQKKQVVESIAHYHHSLDEQAALEYMVKAFPHKGGASEVSAASDAQAH